MLRIFILIGAVVGSNLLMGQSQSALPTYDTVVKVSLLTNGEFKLKRLQATNLAYPIVKPGGSFAVLVRNQEGILFKKVGWKIANHKWKNSKKQAEFKHDSIQGDNFKLRIKPSFSLHRQVAYVQVQKRDTLIVRVPDASNELSNHKDSLIKYILLNSPKKPVPQTWKTIKNDGSLITIQHRKLVIEQVPGKKTALLPSSLQVIPRSGKPRSFAFRDFEPGDTLCFYVTATPKPLKAIWLTRGQDTLINRFVDTLAFADTVVVQDEKLIVLHLEGYLSFKKLTATIAVTRIHPVKPDSSYQIVDSLFQIQTPILYDTVLFPVIDQSIILSPTREIDREPFAQIEVQIPQRLGEGYQLGRIAYWLGIGRDCLNNYLSLEASVPANWSKPGVAPAMGAFLLGRSLLLPPIGAVDAISNFSKRPIELNKQGQKMDIRAGLPRGQNMGILDLNAIKNSFFVGRSQATNSPSYNFFACFQNKSTANPYPIQLKVIGYYLKTTNFPSVRKFKETKTYKLPIEQ